MTPDEQLNAWLWLRTESHPDVIAFREVLAALPETAPTMRRTGIKFINGKSTSFETPAEPGEGWDGETI